MPRANRDFLLNQLWHLTHRCHEKASCLRLCATVAATRNATARDGREAYTPGTEGSLHAGFQRRK